MLTFPDLLRAIIQANLEILTIVVPVLVIASLAGLRQSVMDSRQAIRSGIRKRSQLR